MQGSPVQGEGFQLAVGIEQDRAAGGLVYAAGLHPHQTVFHQVGDADTMFGAQFVQFFQQRDRVQLAVVDRNRRTFFKTDFHIFRGVGSGFRRFGNHAQIRFGFVPGIFQVGAFMAQMPEIGVHAVGPRFGYRHGNAAFFRIIDGVFPRTDVPQPPRRNNLQMRSQRLDGQLEPDLVVALAGCAVGNGHRAFLFGNAGQRLGDDRPRH